jgi:hypothetical protein
MTVRTATIVSLVGLTLHFILMMIVLYWETVADSARGDWESIKACRQGLSMLFDASLLVFLVAIYGKQKPGRPIVVSPHDPNY